MQRLMLNRAPLKAFTRSYTNVAEPLSKRQIFNQIQPPPPLFKRLERLGFGSLPRTKRYAGILKRNKQDKQESSQQMNSQECQFPFLSFFAGAKTPASFPPETLGEIAFVGRSNVGKSSLLNNLAASTIVRTSDKPGLTQQINFYSAGRTFYMVDTPGYGFACANEEERQRWRHLIETYMGERKTLRQVYIVIDARHGLKVADLDFLRMLDRKSVRFQIVLTKCDLPTLPVLARRVTVVQQDLLQFRHADKHVLLVSSKTGAGIKEMKNDMLRFFGTTKTK